MGEGTHLFKDKTYPMLKNKIPVFAFLALVYMVPLAFLYSYTGKWLYIALMLAPFAVAVSIKYPVIFPFGLYAMLLPFDFILVIGGSSFGPTYTMLLGLWSIGALFINGLIERRLCTLHHA